LAARIHLELGRKKQAAEFDERAVSLLRNIIIDEPEAWLFRRDLGLALGTLALVRRESLRDRTRAGSLLCEQESIAGKGVN
jgi:hypothetical protein